MNPQESPVDSIEVESIPDAYRVDFLRLIAVPKRRGRSAPNFQFTTEDGDPIAFVVVDQKWRSAEYRVFSDPEAIDGLFKVVRARRLSKNDLRVIDSKTEETIGSIDAATTRSFALDRPRWILRDEAGAVRGRVYQSSKFRNIKSIISTLLSITLILVGVHILLNHESEIRFEIDGRPAAWGAKHMHFFKMRFDLDLSDDAEGVLPRPIALSVAILEFLRND
jgi:hypothetical protein